MSNFLPKYQLYSRSICQAEVATDWTRILVVFVGSGFNFIRRCGPGFDFADYFQRYILVIFKLKEFISPKVTFTVSLCFITEFSCQRSSVTVK